MQLASRGAKRTKAAGESPGSLAKRTVQSHDLALLRCWGERWLCGGGEPLGVAVARAAALTASLGAAWHRAPWPLAAMVMVAARPRLPWLLCGDAQRRRQLPLGAPSA